MAKVSSTSQGRIRSTRASQGSRIRSTKSATGMTNGNAIIAIQREMDSEIDELHQQLLRNKAETQRLRDKLNCLVSLVRRSWNGDRNASIHLANIVGLDIPPHLLENGVAARPSSAVNSIVTRLHPDIRAAQNWERMTRGLMEFDKVRLEEEGKEQQQQYMENRSRFMDEVLQSHHQSMSRTPLSRPPSAKLTVVDQQFIQKHNAVKPDGRNENRRPQNRSRSALIRRPKPGTKDCVVEQTEMRLRDLFVDASDYSSSVKRTVAVSVPPERPKAKPPRSYGEYKEYDAKQYLTGNLFSPEGIVRPRPLPLNAAVLRELDQQRARPRSAVIQANFKDGSPQERPLKYETTRPVSNNKPPVAKPSLQDANDPNSENVNDDSSVDLEVPSNENLLNSPPALDGAAPTEEEGETETEISPPPISVQVKNATERRESLNKFAAELRELEELEDTFQNSTFDLQKRLGLHENGLV